MQNPSVFGVSRLALGTVQFGMHYGVANTQGRVSPEQANAMLAAARDAGIDTLDTAIAYGDAEELLGRIGVTGFRLISKVPGLHRFKGAIDDWVLAQVEGSLARLRIQSLAGLMLHAPDELLGPHGEDIARGMNRAREAGLVERVGISVYSPEQLAKLVNILQLDIIQIPLNVFDRRFAETGWLDKLASNGVEIHARSVFLQGLLLMPAERVPSKFAPYRPLIDNWHAWLAGEAAGISPVQACVAHVASYACVARIVVGADSLVQLQDIIAAATETPHMAPASLASSATPLINPAQWNAL